MKVSYVFLAFPFPLLYHVLPLHPSISLASILISCCTGKSFDLCYEIHEKHKNTLRGQNVGSLMLNLVVIKFTTYL